MSASVVSASPMPTTRPCDGRPAVSGIGYVLTHHPRRSQTFIDAELRAIEAAGELLAIFAMNEPDPDQIVTDDARRWHCDTVYLKAAGPSAAAAAMTRLVRRRAGALAAVTWLAVRTSGRSPGALARRLAHLGEAIIVWDRARHQGIDRLHAHFAQAPSTIAWLACELGRRTHSGPVSYTITIHGLGEMARPDEDLPREKVANAAQIRFVCDAAERHFEALDRPAATTVIRCGIDLEEFSRRPDRPIEGPAAILIVGRLTEAKGQRHALRAVDVLHRQGVAASLALVGTGEDLETLRQLVASLRLTGSVEFRGELPPEQVRAELDRADVLCLPSYDEGLPVAIIEALAVGCPVVASDIAGIPELVSDRISGRLVDPGDVGSLAAALIDAVTDDEARATWITNGRRAVEQHHDQSATLPQVLAMLGVTSPEAQPAPRSPRDET